MRKISHHQMGVLYGGDQVIVTANEESRFLLVAARPLNEPVARGGPFVMGSIFTDVCIIISSDLSILKKQADLWFDADFICCEMENKQQ